MNNLVNLTPFAAVSLPSMDRQGEERLLTVVAAHFRLPPAGRSGLGALALAEEQPPVALTDEYWGEPASSSLRVEGQSAYHKPGTDIHLLGHAWAPQGQRTRQSELSLGVGATGRTALVFGDRYWTTGLAGLRPSEPAPFEKVAIRYEYCFGGSCEAGAAPAVVEASDRNPVGRGLVVSELEALGQPLPNFEDPEARIGGPSDRPRPVGFGPVARHWLPRRRHAGTYDAAWVRQRAPLWPLDFDERFFCAAPPELCASPRLTGGETVTVVGAHRDGTLAFELPAPRLVVKVSLLQRALVAKLALDGVIIDTDAERCTMLWRVALPVAKELGTLESVVVRELEAWELDR